MQMNTFDHMPRVLWRDGDLITEEHLKGHERWVEGQASWSRYIHGWKGLVRSKRDSDHNTRNRSPLVQIKSSGAKRRLALRASLAPIQVVLPSGRVLDTSKETDLDIELRKAPREYSEILVVLEPKTDPLPAELLDSPYFYRQTVQLRGVEPGEVIPSESVPIAKFQRNDEAWIPCGTFLADCCTIIGSQALEESCESIVEQLSGVYETARNKLPELTKKALVNETAAFVSELARRVIDTSKLMQMVVTDPMVTPERFMRCLHEQLEGLYREYVALEGMHPEEKQISLPDLSDYRRERDLGSKMNLLTREADRLCEAISRRLGERIGQRSTLEIESVELDPQWRGIGESVWSRMRVHLNEHLGLQLRKEAAKKIEVLANLTTKDRHECRISTSSNPGQASDTEMAATNLGNGRSMPGESHDTWYSATYSPQDRDLPKTELYVYFDSGAFPNLRERTVFHKPFEWKQWVDIDLVSEEVQ